MGLMGNATTFTYDRVSIDVTTATIHCRYLLDDEVFTEIATIPGGNLIAAGVPQAAWWYFLLAGVSYYKTNPAPDVVIADGPSSPDDRTFLETFLIEGLGEFAFRNGMDISQLRVRGLDGVRAPSTPIHAEGHVLIPFGGGLDSLVTVHELAGLAERAALFVAERPGARFEAIELPAQQTGLEIMRATRAIDPKLLDGIDRGYLNGHVPVTGILSALGVTTALAHGFGALAMSNERSASSATTTGPFGAVNHQWSKGLAFELGFSKVLATQIPGFRYFSWLRNRSELSIAEVFAGIREYHPLFRSCNRAFHQDPVRRLDTWCGECDKCLFIDLALAPFLSRTQLSEIFSGVEPLENEALRAQLEILCDTADGVRPFECVGDASECQEALLLTAQRDDRATNAMIQDVAAKITDSPKPALEQPVTIPKRFLRA